MKRFWLAIIVFLQFIPPPVYAQTGPGFCGSGTIVGNSGGGLTCVSGLTNARLSKSGTYTVATADNGSTIALGGNAFFALTFPTPSTVNATQINLVVNEDSVRGKSIVITGGTNFILYPLQTAIVFNDNGTWQVQLPGRWRIPGATYLATTVSVFVDNVNGNDSNDCLAAGTGGACLTLTHARDIVTNNIDFNGQQVVIQAAVGQSWTETFDLRNGWVGGGQFIIDGGGSSFTAPGGKDTFNLEMGVTGFFELQNMTISAPASHIAYNVNGPCVCNLGANVTLSSAGNIQLLASGSGAVLSINNNFTISGGATAALAAFQGGFLVIQNGITVTVSANISYSTAFALAQQGGQLQSESDTFSLGGNTVTGVRYNANQNGVIATSGGGANYFPGSSAGTTATGGQYN